MKDFVKKHQHQLLALLNTIVIFSYAFMISGLYYETNDDATLSNIANGAFGANTQDLIYINIWFSYAVKFLHKIMPSVNFIVVIQLILTFISIYAVINMILDKYGSVYGLVMSNILFIPFATELISKFQYVKTSTIIIVAGLLLIATNLSKFNNKIVGGFALVITGCAIRFESFFAAGALSAFTLLLYFFKLDKKGKITAIKQMFVLFALVFSLEMVNSVYYKTNADWTEYTVYNEARTNLSDYKENYIPLYFNDVVARGFTENDVQLIYCGNYFDNTFFDTDTIDKAAAAVGNKPVKNIIADYLHICINLFLNINEKFYTLL